ncbi:MAG: coproporphyrinogen III oxidase [Acidithiobacillales bacterium SG8_45]|jgi:oxygen-independent coproporphyrinogen-3 oxidase|nr:MAG: coproporphyrinogen III oxidase [Acidithiobacillales bacterium SG8_45]
MKQTVKFDAELIRRYDKSGPRYTSYPTAVQFHEQFNEARYREIAAATNTGADARPLSLYFHLPFCNTVCYYCGCNKIVTKDRSRAAPYLERLHLEIALQGELFDRRRKVTQLHWGGGTPTFISHDEMRALMEQTRKHFNLFEDDTGEYSIEVDPREVGPGTLSLLRELGFNRLSMGVQDFNPVVQKAVNRIQPKEQTLAVLNEARELGFGSINMDLIYGLPHQSVKTFTDTLKQVIAADPDRLSVFNYAHLPEMFKPQRRINVEDLPSPEEKLNILQTSIDMLIDAGYVYIGMDHFAKPDDELAVAQREGSLYRNFQGYSTHASCDMIGMGVTAIGSIGNSFSQNVRAEDEYYAALDQQRLPLLRGYELNADDLLRREVISQLICHFRLEFNAIERQFEIDFADYFAAELEALVQMQEDGLLTISDRSIDVSPAGMLLIRNICMVFDAYLSQRKQSYSKVI